MDSWILAHIEDGSVYWWDAGGEWHTEGREKFIREGDELEILCDMYSEIKARMEADDVFRVLFTDVDYVVDGGGWGYSGYSYPEAYIDVGGYHIVDAEFEMRQEDGHA